MTYVLLFIDLEFPNGTGTQVEKPWKIQAMGVVTMESPGTENPWG